MESYEATRRRRIDSTVKNVLQGYGVRVMFDCVCNEVQTRFDSAITRNEVYNSLNRLRRRGEVSGGMRYAGSRGWKLI